MKKLLLSLICVSIVACGGGSGNVYQDNEPVTEQAGNLFQLAFDLGSMPDAITCEIIDAGDPAVVGFQDEEVIGNTLYYNFDAIAAGQTTIKVDCTNSSIGAPDPMQTTSYEFAVTIN